MAMFAAFAALAVNQVMVGQTAKTEAGYNASLYEQQAGQIDIVKALQGKQYDLQKDIQGRQFDIQRDIAGTQYKRVRAQMTSATMARVAKAGLDYSGSPVAVMIDNLTQMGIDETITKYNINMAKATGEYDINMAKASGAYNLDMEKTRAVSSAAEVRRKGKSARNATYSNAFSTLMTGAYGYGDRKGWFNTSAGATTGAKKG